MQPNWLDLQSRVVIILQVRRNEASAALILSFTSPTITAPGPLLRVGRTLDRASENIESQNIQ